mmetsp:Transcript_109592/g.261366  ORF Transcript_109592/g.261366 Transcript_109592/m.261366 type:complete len:244 (+) Transcript_109592:318-1049(+)
MQSRGRIVHVSGLLHSIPDHLGFGLTRRADERHTAGVVGDGTEADCNDLSPAHSFDATEIASCSSLRGIVQLIQPSRGEMVATLTVEGDMAVGADPTHEEADSSQGANLGLVLRAPLVHLSKHSLLEQLLAGVRLPHSQAEVHLASGPHVLHGERRLHVITRLTRGTVARLPVKTDLGAIHQQCSLWIEAETLDVVLTHVVVEAVVLRRGDGIELIYLHKSQLPQLWYLRAQTELGGFALGLR